MNQYSLTICDDTGKALDEISFEGGTFVLGRSESCDIHLPSSSVSRQHARLSVRPEGLVVEDLGSSNGIFIHGERVARPVLLSSDTTLVMGTYILRVGVQTPEAPPTHVPPSPAGPVAASAFYLVRFGDELEGEYFELGRDLDTIGRSKRNTLQLPDPSISRNHAQIRYRSGQYVVSDLGSGNGTRVNDTPVDHPVVLREGDRVAFGDVHYLFTATPDGAKLAVLKAAMQRGPSTSGSAPPLWLSLSTAGAALLLILTALLLITYLPGREGAQSAAGDTAAEARESLVRAEVAEREERWSDAIAAFENALLLTPSAEAEAGLERVRAEERAAQQLENCETRLSAALNLESTGQALAAAETYEDTRTCLERIDENRRASSRAQTIIRDDIEPSLSVLYRHLGALALRQDDFESAAQSLGRAVEIMDRNLQLTTPESLRAQHHRALIGAADLAWEREAWSRARALYEQADAIDRLDSGRQDRLRQARRRE